jgi:hypothetical protein
MISFIGGTGKLGIGLAMRFALVEEEVVIGSRDINKANTAVEKIRGKIPGARVWAMGNQEAVEKSDVVILTVPYQAQKDLLLSISDSLEGKILVSVVNPFRCVDGEFRGIPVGDGSAAEEAQVLVPGAKVVSAFKNISHEVFTRIDKPLSCDTIVCSDHQHAKERVMYLARKIGVHPIDGGSLRVSRYLEAVTVLLLNLNERYGGSACFKVDFHRSESGGNSH